MDASGLGESREAVSVIAHLEHAPVPIAYVSSGGASVALNAAWRALLGDSPREPWAWIDALASPGRERVRREFVRALKHGLPEEVEVSGRAATGSPCDLVVAIAPTGEGSTGALVIAWDVTERRRNEDRLAFMAGHDALTGLANRRAFDEALALSVHRADRGARVHVLLFDIDHLKVHNDTHGHLAGDQVLVNAALLLRRFVRATDIPARIGGDEFAVLLEDSTPAEAETIAERIRAAAAEGGLVDGGHESGLGFSCGVALLGASSDARTVMEHADAALYAAKAAGRNRVVVWSSETPGSEVPDRIASVVRDAFASDGFRLVYQPVVRLSDGSVAYYESLVRLHAASGRAFAPSEFLPVVERLGMMPRLTRRVVDLVLGELAAVPGASVSVNLSGADLADRDLARAIEQAVRSARTAKGRLILEISEATLLAHLASGRQWMEALAPAGCRFVLDDFGTGVGMFVLLREPRIEQVKLSRTVTNALSVEDGRHAFVLALRELVESQGKAAVATYVETERLLGEAREAGFALGQGYQVGEPEGDLAALVARLDG